MSVNSGRKTGKKRIAVLILLIVATAAATAGIVHIRSTEAAKAAAAAKKSIDTAKIHQVPDSYGNRSSETGKLVDLSYTSSTYDTANTKVTKHATVYLPYRYSSKKKYNIVYLMHGYGGSEHTYLGSVGSPRYFKTMLDNMIAKGDIDPVIVVTPTITWGSEDYYRTMDNFQKELNNDLIPAVEGKYSTYAKSTDSAGLRASRGHRAMAGFSMGGCITWQTLRDDVRYFRYFLPMSCPLYYYDPNDSTDRTADMASQIDRGIVSAGYGSSDFCVFAATGTKDYMRHELINQVTHLKSYTGEFSSTDTDFSDGNLMLYVADGHHHSFKQSYVYLYNGMIRFFRK